jgi:hypothetical protein
MEPTTKLPFYCQRNFWLLILSIQALTNLFLLQNYYNSSATIFDYIVTTIALIGGLVPGYLIGFLVSGFVGQVSMIVIFGLFSFFVFQNLFSERVKVIFPVSFLVLSILTLLIGYTYASGI